MTFTTISNQSFDKITAPIYDEGETLNKGEVTDPLEDVIHNRQSVETSEPVQMWSQHDNEEGEEKEEWEDEVENPDSITNPGRNQALFGTFDSMISDAIQKMDIKKLFSGKELLSKEEIEEVVKICFAGTVVVFSSFMGESTNAFDEKGDNTDTNILDFDVDDNHSIEVDKLSTSVAGKSTVLNCGSFYKRHQEKLCQRPMSSKKSSGSLIDLDNEVEPLQELTTNFIKNEVEIPSSSDSYDGKQTDDNAYSQKSSKSTNKDLLKANASIRRPSIPESVLQMMWGQVITSNDSFDLDDEEMILLVNIIKHILVDKLAFLDVISHHEVSSALECEDESLQKHENDIYCIKVNHEIYTLYGQHLANNMGHKMRLNRCVSGDSSECCDSTGSNNADIDDWNPEVKLNSIMSTSCLNCVEVGSKNQIPSSYFRTQYQYSLEMLPWHLMRSQQFKDAVKLLTSPNFLYQRLATLGVIDATYMVIADLEELLLLYDSIGENDENSILVQGYECFYDIIRRQNGDIDPSKASSCLNLVSCQNDDDDDFASQDLNDLFMVSQALLALGDSLLKNGFSSSGMKFFCLSLVRLEHIHQNDPCMLTETDENDLNPDFPNIDGVRILLGDVLRRIASIYQTDNPNETDAMLCYDRALSFYSRGQSKRGMKGIARTLMDIGELHLNRQEYDSAQSCLQESLSMWRSDYSDENSTEEAEVLLLMANLNRCVGSFPEAIDCFTQALYNKITILGKSHGEIGDIHQDVGSIYSELGQYHKALTHHEEALRIRKIKMNEFKADHDDRSEERKDNEVALAETLQSIGQIYEIYQEYHVAWTSYIESLHYHRLHIVDLASSDHVLMIEGLVDVLKYGSDGSALVDNFAHSLTLAIRVGLRLYPVDISEEELKDDDSLLEIETQIANILNDLGIVYGAKYVCKIKSNIHISDEKMIEEAQPDLLEAKKHFEMSVKLRYRRLKRLEKEITKSSEPDLEEYEQVNIAFIQYEMGKIFSLLELTKYRDESHQRHRLSSYSSLKKTRLEECAAALSHFEEARSILQDNIIMADVGDGTNSYDDPWHAMLQKMPKIYEEMLQFMAVLYRKLEEYDKSVHCYNEVSILLTRIGLDDDSLDNNEVIQKEKVASSSESIGDILFDTGEYSRALRSYDEALQLRRLVDKESLVVSETLCRKGDVFIKMKEWEKAVLTFDEALRIRVDCLPQDHQDIATCFHKIANAYEGDGKLEQAFEYYKKAQRLISGNLIEPDVSAADLFYDLGNVVLTQDRASENNICPIPTEEDLSLALTCLALARDTYKRIFGENALEVANALTLMGRIYYKYKEYDVAMKAFEDALDIYSDAPLDQRIRIANTLNHLGLTQFMSPKEVTGAYHTLKYFNLAQSIYEEKSSEINEDFADILVNKGVLLAQEGEFLQSITYYNKAITIYRTLFGNDSVKISIILEKLGSCLIQQREFKEALAIFKEALELRKKNGRENDLETANILFGMGIIMCESGKLNKALDYYEQTLNIRREILGTNNVEVGLVLNNVGSVFARNKEYTRAQGPWQSAIDIYRNAGLSDGHPKLVCTLGNLNIVSKSLVSTAPVKPLRKMDVY